MAPGGAWQCPCGMSNPAAVSRCRHCGNFPPPAPQPDYARTPDRQQPPIIIYQAPQPAPQASSPGINSVDAGHTATVSFGVAAGASAGWMFGKFLGCLGIIVALLAIIYGIGFISRLTSSDPQPKAKVEGAADATPRASTEPAQPTKPSPLRAEPDSSLAQRVRLDPATGKPTAVRRTPSLCSPPCAEEWSTAILVFPGNSFEVYVAETDLRALRAARPSEDWNHPAKFGLRLFAFDTQRGEAEERLAVFDVDTKTATYLEYQKIGAGGIAEGTRQHISDSSPLENANPMMITLAGVLLAIQSIQ